MADHAEKNYNDAAGVAKGAAETFMKLMEAIATFLDGEGKYSAQKEMAKWIRSGGGLYAYDTNGRNADELKIELDVAKIPYIELKETNKILIRGCDIDAVNEMHRDVLIAKSNYYQEVDGKELENAVARFDKLKDKELFTLQHLNRYEAEVIKNKCNQISAGFMVGITKNGPEDYDLTILASHMLEQDERRQDFCKAYLDAMLSLYGQNSELKTQQIDVDARIDAQVAKLKKDPDTHYIVGVDDKSKYIELTQFGFEYYEVDQGDDGTYKVREVLSAKNTDRDYDAELQRCMDRIKDRAVIDSNSLLNEHLASTERVIKSDRPEKSYEAYQSTIAEHQISRIIDKMVNERIERESPGFKDSVDIFSFYVHESTEILAAAMEDRIPDGYRKEEMEEIEKAIKEGGLMKEHYQTIVVAQARGYQATCHIAQEQTKHRAKQETQPQRQGRQTGQEQSGR